MIVQWILGVLDKVRHVARKLKNRFRPASREVEIDVRTLKNRNYHMYNILDDLREFTGLSENEILDRLRRRGQFHFKEEFKWYRPKSYAELKWYYRTSTAYLFANSVHPYWSVLDILDSKDGPVLDYGGGAGNNALGLASRDIEVDYLDISIIQREFIRFRRRRHEVNNQLHIVGANPDSLREAYGAIVLQDVLEHIPDYQNLLHRLIGRLRPGGYILEQSPFDPNAPDIALHLKAEIPLGVAMKGMEKVGNHVWRKRGESTD